jgi:MFS family permease
VNAAQRSLAIWRWARPLGEAFFYAPVFFLYWNQSLTVERVLQLEAVYYFAVVVLEVPSGVLSDRVGRALTLRLSAAAGVVAYSLFFFAEGSFLGFAAAQVALAVHFSFRSGTDAAWHYDLLEHEGLAHEFPAREARLKAAAFWVRAACALVGGGVGSFDLAAPYALSLVAAGVVLAAMLASPELPAALAPADTHGRSGGALRRALGKLRRPFLAWVLAYVVLQTTLEHVPYEFMQPYLAAVFQGLGFDVAATPLATGFVVAGVAVVGGAAARLAPAAMARFGALPTLLGVSALQTAVIAALSLAVHPVLAVLLLLRSVQPAIGHIVVDAAVAPRVARSERATYLSLHSLAGRIGYSAVLLGLGVLVQDASRMSEHDLRLVLGSCAIFAAAGTAVLAALRGRAERAPSPRVAGS